VVHIFAGKTKREEVEKGRGAEDEKPRASCTICITFAVLHHLELIVILLLNMNMNMIFIQSAIDILELVILLYIHSTLFYSTLLCSSRARGSTWRPPSTSSLFFPLLSFFFSSLLLFYPTLFILTAPHLVIFWSLNIVDLFRPWVITVHIPVPTQGMYKLYKGYTVATLQDSSGSKTGHIDMHFHSY